MSLEAIRFKFAHIFLPLMALAVAFITAYLLANWLLVANTAWIPLNQDLVNIWLPSALGVVLVGALIAPRFRCLRMSERRNIPFLFAAGAMAVLIVPTLFAQAYITAASGTLTHVARADLIASVPTSKYYAASSVCVDRQNPLVARRNELSGGHDEYLEFKIYVLAPVCGTTGRPVWIGFRYTHSTDSSASDPFKESVYRDFAQGAQKEFDTYDFSTVQYFEQLGRTDDRRNFESAMPERMRVARQPPIILIPHTDAFEARTGDNLRWSFLSFGIAAGVFLIMLLIPSLNQEAVADSRKPPGARARREPSLWLALVTPRRDSYGLPILIDINLAVYGAIVFSGLGVVAFRSDDLLAWGAEYGPAIHGVGVLRLISSQFVHGGLMHIALNLYGLFIVGLFLSPVIRNAGLIVAYLACGLGGSFASLLIHPTTVSFGASGAIMGLLGLVLVLALLGDKRIAAARSIIIVNCLIFAGLTLAQGAVDPGIDNAAHIGGLVTGFVIALPIRLFSWGLPLSPGESSHGNAGALQAP